MKTNFGADAYSVTNGKTGYDLYYQFGRKDAFRSVENNLNPADGTSLVFKKESVNIGATIKNPTIFYSTGNESYDSNPYIPFYYNAWNATYTTYSTATTKIDGLEKVVKTVYDPCPVGYTIPPANTFTAFTKDNMPVDGNGRSYTINGKKLYFPLAGRRYDGDGTMTTEVGQFGWYWTAINGTSITGRLLYFVSNSVIPVSVVDRNSPNSRRANGYSIRPVREN